MHKWPPLSLILWGPLYLIYKRDYKLSLRALVGFVFFRLLIVTFFHISLAQEIFISAHTLNDTFLGLLFFALLTLFVVPSWHELFLWFAYTLLLSLAGSSSPQPQGVIEQEDVKTTLLSGFSLFLCDILIGTFLVGIGEVTDHGADPDVLWLFGILIFLFGGFPFWLIGKKLKKSYSTQ